MTDFERRAFLKQAGLGTAALAAAQLTVAASAEEKPEAKPDAQNKIVMGWIGCGGQGTNLLKSFVAQPEVTVAYVCDPEARRATQAAAAVQSASGKAPQIVSDLRKVLDDKSVDAVCVATPDHWHGPATILACEAGKHVYVEKPCSHNIREGRLMIEAARRQQSRRAGWHAGAQFAGSHRSDGKNCAAARSVRSLSPKSGTASVARALGTILLRLSPTDWITICGLAPRR